MDDRGNIYSEEDLKEMQKINKDKLSQLGKLLEVMPEDNVSEMSKEDRIKWYKKMMGQRREFPLPK